MTKTVNWVNLIGNCLVISRLCLRKGGNVGKVLEKGHFVLYLYS